MIDLRHCYGTRYPARYRILELTDHRGDPLFLVHDGWLRATVFRAPRKTRAAAQADITARIKEIQSMTYRPENWTETDLNWATVACRSQVASAGGWHFFAPSRNEPSGGNVLAVSLDYIGESGPVVFDTGSPSVPERL